MGSIIYEVPMSKTQDELTHRGMSASLVRKQNHGCSAVDSRGQVATQFRVDVSLLLLIEWGDLVKQWPPRNCQFTVPPAGSFVSDDVAPLIRSAKLN